MKNQDQANNNNCLNDPTVANYQKSQVEFEDLPISGEQGERVKGGGGGRVNTSEIIVSKICDSATPKLDGSGFSGVAKVDS